MAQFDWLVAAFPETTFTVFDTETTGLEPKTNRVVEAGAIRFDARGIISRFNVLINPGMPMPAEVTKINGITDSMLAKQPNAAAIVLPDFLRFIGDSVLIAHNAQFDINFINEELARLGKPTAPSTGLSTRSFSHARFFPDCRTTSSRVSRRNSGLPRSTRIAPRTMPESAWSSFWYA